MKGCSFAPSRQQKTGTQPGRNYPGTIKTEQVIDFLKHLQRHVRGKLLIVSDGVATHRSRLVRGYLKSLKGKIWVERLPAYAPELNPVEYLWGCPVHCPASFEVGCDSFCIPRK